MDICKQWNQNKLVNPKTGRKIKKDGPTYKSLEMECERKIKKSPASKSPKVQLKARTLVKAKSERKENASTIIKFNPKKDKVTEVLEMVMHGQLGLDPCTLMDKRGTIKSIQKYLLKHETASPTENIKLSLRLTDGSDVTVFLKIWPNVYDFNKKETQYAGVDFEKEVYKYITKNILLTHQSPNFIPFLDYATCPLKTTKYDIKKDFKFKHLTKQIADHKDVHLNVLITGSSENMVTLHDLGKVVKDTSQIASIVFQLAHALYCLQTHGISHLDLHLGNVLVEYMEQPLVLQYTTNGFTVKFKTNFMVKIFDFDQANARFKFNELYLDRFYREVSAYAQNTDVPERDLYQITCGLLKLRNPQITHVVENVFTYPSSPRDKLLRTMNHDTGRKFSVSLSMTSAEKIAKKFTPVISYRNGNTSMSESNVYDILLSDLEKVLLPNEWNELKKYPNFPIIKSCLFELIFNRKRKNIVSMKLNQGWFCKFVHQTKEGIFVPLKDLFSKRKDFDNLTQFLDKTTQQPDSIFQI
jgi:serine/threonine protein kinase